MNRLYAVEPPVLGHRRRGRSSLSNRRARKLAAYRHRRLLSAIQSQANPLKVVGQGTNADKALAAIAKDLLANRGKSVVVAGPRQPAAVHQVVHQINQALGNVGPVVTYLKPVIRADPAADRRARRNLRVRWPTAR